MTDDSSLRSRITRRGLVAGAAAGTVALAATPATAQRCPPVTAERVKGPPVFRDLDQVDIDEGYDNDVYAFNAKNLAARRSYNNRIARSVLAKPERAKYGPTEIENLDVYRTKRPDAPVLMFIQGGSWRGGARAAQFATYAEPFVKAGANFVVPEFADVRDVGGDIFPLVEQTRRAVAWAYRNAKTFGGDPDRLYIISRSSGSHVTSCLLITEWEKQDLPRDIIKGAVMGSGMYDLAPVRLSKRSWVKFTDAMVNELSAIRHVERIHTPVVIGVGAFETPEFQRQAREFAAALKAAGKPHELIVAPGYNHYEIGETIGHPYAVLGRAMFGMLKLDSA